MTKSSSISSWFEIIINISLYFIGDRNIHTVGVVGVHSFELNKFLGKTSYGGLLVGVGGTPVSTFKMSD